MKAYKIRSKSRHGEYWLRVFDDSGVFRWYGGTIGSDYKWTYRKGFLVQTLIEWDKNSRSFEVHEISMLEIVVLAGYPEV